MKGIRARFYYDESQETLDKYTVCYRGYRFLGERVYPYAGLSDNPLYPCGFFQHGSQSFSPIDGWGIRKADYAHLGKRIKWNGLPKEVQVALLREARRFREADELFRGESQ
jgi:hypothetical protein